MILKAGAHIHFMGICGTAMASLAGIMKARGYKITGSDQAAYPPMSTQLESLGIDIMKDYNRKNLEPRPDFVVVGNVITKTYDEAVALLESDIPYTSLPRALADFVIEDRQSVVISGTHGKTTTTAIMAWIAQVCGKKAGYLIGGIPQNFSRSFKNPEESSGERDYFIIEGDEYDTAFFDKVPKFKHYKPRHVILTGVEFDHADIYDNLEDVLKAFRLLMGLIPEDGHLVYNGEDSNIKSILPETSCRKIMSFGFNEGDYQAKNIRVDRDGSVNGAVNKTVFDIEFQGQKIVEIEMKMFGSYNVSNAMSAYILARQMDWPSDDVVQAIKTFKGVKRRQEVLGEPGGVTLIEDFAHHPTAVKGTIESVQSRYQGRRVFSVFEPRSATSRRSIFQQQYLEAFSEANVAVIASAYDQSRISEEDRFSTGKLVTDLKSRDVEAHEFGSTNEIVDFLCEKTISGDVILIMSNGGFDGIYTKLTERLRG